MKRILFALAVLLSAQFFAGSFYAGAQVIDSSLTSKGGSLYMGGARLDSKAIANLQDFDLQMYRKGRAKFISGVTVASIGAVPTVLFTYSLVNSIQGSIERKNMKDPIPGSGMPEALMLVSGVGILIFEGIGIPLLCSGLKDIKTSVNNYNGTHPVQLSILPTVDYIELGGNLKPTVGVSLALSF